MLVYIAGHDQEEAKRAAHALRQAGYDNNASWVHESDFGRLSSEAKMRSAAERDLAELVRCDVVLSLAASRCVPGGKHVEVGAALALGIRCIHVGRPEHIFHHHPLVTVVPDIGAAIEVLADHSDATAAA